MYRNKLYLQIWLKTGKIDRQRWHWEKMFCIVVVVFFLKFKTVNPNISFIYNELAWDALTSSSISATEAIFHVHTACMPYN